MESDYKDLCQQWEILIEQISGDNLEDAAYTLGEIIAKVYSIDATLKEIELNWNLSKRENFYGFLTDPVYSNGLLRLVVPQSESLIARNKIISEFLEIFKDSKLLKNDELKKYTFILDLDGAIFIYIDYSAPDFYRILQAFERALEGVNRFRALYLSEGFIPPVIVGEISTKYLRNLQRELVEEIVHLVEWEVFSKPKVEDKWKIFKLDFVFPELLAAAETLLDYKRILEERLKEGSIPLFYQPIFELDNGEIFGIELLSRIFDEKGKPIPASKFIDLIKRQNLQLEFDKIVLKTVLKKSEVITNISKNIFLNLFPDSLAHPEIVKLLLQILEKFEKLNAKLNLELTEHSVITNRDILEKIEHGNLSIAFDDFGSGYTNFKTVATLAHTKRAETLKLDGDLVEGMNESNILKKVVISVAYMAKSLDLNLIFEGVSDENVLKRVKEVKEKVGLKRAYAQGYYFAEPRSID